MTLGDNSDVDADEEKDEDGDEDVAAGGNAGSINRPLVHTDQSFLSLTEAA